MEILVPAECRLIGYDIKTDSLEVYERLLADCEDPFVPKEGPGRPDADGIALIERRFFYHPEDGVTVWVMGPPQRVKVMVENV